MMARYLSGLCAAGLGLCGGGWLIVTAVLLGGAPSDATLVTLATGAGVALVSAVALWCWALAWRQRMRGDGALPPSPRAPSPRQRRRGRRALRREMRRAARDQARTRPPARRRPARSAPPDAGLAGLGLAGPGLAHRAPDPRAPDPRDPGTRAPDPRGPDTRAPDPRDPGGLPGGACSPPSAADAATLMAELRAILEPLLAASGEGEEAW